MKDTDFYTYAQTNASLSRETVTAKVVETVNADIISEILFEFGFSSHIGIDCETRGFTPYPEGIHGVGLSDGIRHFYLIDNTTNRPHIKELLSELNQDKIWVGHNLKFDCKWLELVYNITLYRIEDTYLASYVLNPTAKHKISALASEYLNRYPMDFGELVSKYSSVVLTSKRGSYYKVETVKCEHCNGTKQERGKVRIPDSKKWNIVEDCNTYLWVEKQGKGMGKEMVLWNEVFKGKKCTHCKGEGYTTFEKEVFPIDFLPYQEVANYCAEDCYESVKLWFIFETLLLSNDLTNIYELERDLMPVLKSMEVRGVKIDRNKLSEVKALLQSNIDFWISEYKLYDKNGNPSSPSQVLNALHNVGIHLESSDKDSLKKVKDNHPLPEIILEYRKATKLLQFANELDVETVHTNYGLTKTGRLSSSDPNLQNIPAKAEEGNLIRQCFIPHKPDHSIIALDYSAFEYRIIAYMSGDALLKECFLTGKDFHGILTGLIFGYEWNYTDKKNTPKWALKQREGVKSLNYGLAYGMGANKLSRMLECSLSEAEDLMVQHRELVPDIWSFLHGSRESAILNGYTKTLWGRKRFYNFTTPELKTITDDVPYSYLEYLLKEKRVNYEDAALLREAMNHPIQGTNADAIKAAKVKVQKEVCDVYNAHLLLTVHDELVLEAHNYNVDLVYRKCKELMESVIDLGDIPVIVEGSIANSWGLAK